MTSDRSTTKCAQHGRISSLLPKCAWQTYVTWHALHDSTESWFACGSSTVVSFCRGGKWNYYSYKFKFFIHFLLEVFPRNLLRSSMDSARGRITWRDMLCMTALKVGLPVAVRQLFRFAVAASEIITVISSNSSFISFWRSFREIFWEVLWTLKLTQSQVGIVGLKIVNSLNRINRCIKFRKRNRFNTRDFVVFFTALWTFWHLIL